MFHNNYSAPISIGSIGWEDDGPDDHYSLGDATNDGHTFVKVQLFEGKDPSVEPNPTRAQGHKILCHINSSMQRIPPKDTRCYVIVPAGMEGVPGAGMIIGTVEPTLDGRLAGNRAIMDFGDQHVIIKGKSVTLAGNDGSYLTVGQPKAGGNPGIQAASNGGTGFLAQDGVAALFANTAGSTTPPSQVQVTPGAVDIVSPATGAGSHRCQVGNGGVSLMTPGPLVLGGGTTFVGIAAGPYSTYKFLAPTSGITNTTGIWFASS